MQGEERRKKVLEYIKESREPVSGTMLAKEFHVSRQVIVQDIALLRASSQEILSTSRGYLFSGSDWVSRVFSVCHEDQEIEKELNLIVDCGGVVEDVFVEHEIYGTLRAELNISSRRKVKEFLTEIQNGQSRPLNHITSGYHYHTISAESEEILEEIKEALKEQNFLVNS